MTHGRGSEGETGEWSGYPVPFTPPRNIVYPALLPLMPTPRLPVVDWTDAPANLNGFVRSAERRNLVSARVPSHFNWPVLAALIIGPCQQPRKSEDCDSYVVVGLDQTKSHCLQNWARLWNNWSSGDESLMGVTLWESWFTKRAPIVWDELN